MQKVNIVIGRFQPFTAGHYVCVETAKKLKGLTTVICMIDTPESKVDKRHPFTTDSLLYAYNELFNSDPYIEKVVPVKNADIVKIAEELKRYGYEIASWTCGTDRYDTYLNMATKYHDQAGLADDFEVIEVKRTDEDISATKARSCLLADDKQTFFSMMPRSVKPSDEFFYSLKKQIDKVYNAQEPEPKKTSRRKRSEQYSLERRVAKLEKLLNEAVALEAKQVGTIYHVCTLDSYLKYVVPKDQLSSSGDWYNWVYKGNEYVSFTRNKNCVVKLREDDDILVQIVVDGDKLSNNYKIGPYNDFAFDGSTGSRVKDDASLREQEECVKGPIKNLSKYVKEVRIDFRYLDSSVISTLKKHIGELGNCVYYNFVSDKHPKFAKLMHGKNKLQNETPISELISSSALDRILVASNATDYMLSYEIKKVKKGIECGLDVNGRYGASNSTPLENVCDDEDSANIVKLLLENGANPDTVDHYGSPVLCAAAKSSCAKAVKLLLKAGANVNAQDEDGNTALMCAVDSGDDILTKVLLKAGADVNIKNKKGDTASDMTTEFDTDIIAMLDKAKKKKLQKS